MEEKDKALSSVNANFVVAIVNRAAQLMQDTWKTTGDERNAFTALLQARDEFLAQEPSSQRKRRTYGWESLLNDLRNYIADHQPAYADSLAPINEWSNETDLATVAQTLRDAAEEISKEGERRDRTASKFEAMNEQQREEYILMWKTSRFLEENGLDVQIEWDREDPNGTIDYRGTVNGTRWAFELTRLREDPEGFHRKAGHPKEGKSLEEQLDDLQQPMPRIPDGPEALGRNLLRVIEHGRTPGKLEALDGAKYCLVIHNQQFTFAPDWREIEHPSLREFDAVLISHEESFPPCQGWEILKQEGLGKPLPSQNLEDMAGIMESRAAGNNARQEQERVRSAWQHIAELDLTDRDILEAVEEAR